MARSPELREILAQAFMAEASYASLHDGDPGTTGENELAITRQPLTWTSGETDGVVTSDSVTFTIPPGTVLTHVGFWTAVTGGEYRDSIINNVAFDEGGTYSVALTYTQE